MTTDTIRLRELHTLAYEGREHRRRLERAVVAAVAAGVPVGEVAAAADMHRNSVRNIINRNRAGGSE